MKLYHQILFSTLLFIGLSFVFSSGVNAVESPECTWVSEVGAIRVFRSAPFTEIPPSTLSACASVDVGSLGFQIPTLGDILTFAIRAFFAIAGLAALFYMLLGAFAWVTSGGDKDAITAAREKIQAAVVGMILLVAVLAIIWTLEQVIFKRRICLGLSCSVTLPGLIESSGKTTFTPSAFFIGEGHSNPLPAPSSSTEDAFCCVCVKDAGGFGDRINAHFAKCVDGVGQPL